MKSADDVQRTPAGDSRSVKATKTCLKRNGARFHHGRWA